MAGKFFIGNSNNIATLPKDILVGDSNNIARKVKGIYVGNSSNQAVKVWPNGRVPEGYQEVEYIRSVYNCNGFETGIVPNSNTRIIITFMFSKIDLAELKANLDSSPTKWDTIAAPFNVPYYEYQLKTGFSSGLRAYEPPTAAFNYFFCTGFGDNTYFLFNEIKTNTTPSEEDVNFVNEQLLNKKITIDLNRSRGTLYYNDELKETFVNTFSDLKTGNICLLSYNVGRVPSSLSLQAIHSTQNQINLYSSQIYKNNNLVRNFIPCNRKTDREPLLYDTVSESFFSSGKPSYPPYLGPDV